MPSLGGHGYSDQKCSTNWPTKKMTLISVRKVNGYHGMSESDVSKIMFFFSVSGLSLVSSTSSGVYIGNENHDMVVFFGGMTDPIHLGRIRTINKMGWAMMMLTSSTRKRRGRSCLRDIS